MCAIKRRLDDKISHVGAFTKSCRNLSEPEKLAVSLFQEDYLPHNEGLYLMFPVVARSGLQVRPLSLLIHSGERENNDTGCDYAWRLVLKKTLACFISFRKCIIGFMSYISSHRPTHINWMASQIILRRLTRHNLNYCYSYYTSE